MLVGMRVQVQQPRRTPKKAPVITTREVAMAASYGVALDDPALKRTAQYRNQPPPDELDNV